MIRHAATLTPGAHRRRRSTDDDVSYAIVVDHTTINLGGPTKLDERTMHQLVRNAVPDEPSWMSRSPRFIPKEWWMLSLVAFGLAAAVTVLVVYDLGIYFGWVGFQTFAETRVTEAVVAGGLLFGGFAQITPQLFRVPDERRTNQFWGWWAVLNIPVSGTLGSLWINATNPQELPDAPVNWGVWGAYTLVFAVASGLAWAGSWMFLPKNA